MQEEFIEGGDLDQLDALLNDDNLTFKDVNAKFTDMMGGT